MDGASLNGKHKLNRVFRGFPHTSPRLGRGEAPPRSRLEHQEGHGPRVAEAGREGHVGRGHHLNEAEAAGKPRGAACGRSSCVVVLLVFSVLLFKDRGRFFSFFFFGPFLVFCLKGFGPFLFMLVFKSWISLGLEELDRFGIQTVPLGIQDLDWFKCSGRLPGFMQGLGPILLVFIAGFLRVCGN